jgi:hypothetical protein
MKVFLDDPDNLDERLVREVYTGPALVPASPWLGHGAPAQPVIAVRSDTASGFWVLDVKPGTGGASAQSVDAPAPWLWVIQTRTDTGWTTRIVSAAERLEVLGLLAGATPLAVRVMAVDRVGNAGPAARVVPTP